MRKIIILITTLNVLLFFSLTLIALAMEENKLIAQINQYIWSYKNGMAALG